MSAVQARSEPVYDSARRLPVTALWRDGWRHRELLGLLVQRELAARYRGTLLGIGWALVTPLAFAAVLWATFSHVARFTVEGTPYVVYVLSGTILLTFVSTGVLAVAGAIVSNTVVFRRVFVPATTFALAAVSVAVVSLALSTVVLLAAQLATGAGIPWTVLLLPVLFALLAAAVTGAGLVVGALATRFADALHATQMLVALLGIATPVFYPVSILPGWAQTLVKLNPVYQFLVAFRSFAYGGTVPLGASVACVVIALAASSAGLAVYTRARVLLPTTL